MLRKTIIALTAILMVSVMAPTEASAWRGGWGWGGGGWGWGLGAVGLGIGLGLAATAPWGYGYPYGYSGYPYGYAGYGYPYAGGYGGCYLVRQQVWTPYGWRWRRVQVCG